MGKCAVSEQTDGPQGPACGSGHAMFLVQQNVPSSEPFEVTGAPMKQMLAPG